MVRKFNHLRELTLTTKQSKTCGDDDLGEYDVFIFFIYRVNWFLKVTTAFI